MTGLFEDHLGVDAVVAYSDGELSPTAFLRAAAHVGTCADCAAQVEAQTTARDLLRSASGPVMPDSLLSSLRSIPLALPTAPRPLDGLGTGSPTRPMVRAGSDHGRLYRVGAGALVAGLAAGALIVGVGHRTAPAGPASDQLVAGQLPAMGDPVLGVLGR